MVITFYPHPFSVLAPRRVPPLLLSLEQRLQAFASCGIRVALVVPFTVAFSRWPPEVFVEKLLLRSFQIREVVVGHDFGFGQGRCGTVATLRTLGCCYHFKVHVVAPVRVDGERVASHRIREMIRQGDLSRAERFLGRPVTVVGRVVRGVSRGRRLGFPTANLEVEAGVLPPGGVYAVWGRLKDRCYPAVANIGSRPTFHPSPIRPPPLHEVHHNHRKRSLNGRRLEVVFIRRLRAERRFSSPQALAQQIARDSDRARSLLNTERLRKVCIDRGRIFMV
jgi:riboflavin kinase/FMN adenylyltransferase